MEGDAVPPVGSPEPDPYDAMEWEWQRAVVRPVAGALGLPPGTVLFTLALFASVPIGAVFQFVPSAAGKKVYSLVAGECPPSAREGRRANDRLVAAAWASALTAAAPTVSLQWMFFKPVLERCNTSTAGSPRWTTDGFSTETNLGPPG